VGFLRAAGAMNLAALFASIRFIERSMRADRWKRWWNE
jgi:hypothetical protein